MPLIRVHINLIHFPRTPYSHFGWTLRICRICSASLVPLKFGTCCMYLFKNCFLTLSISGLLQWRIMCLTSSFTLHLEHIIFLASLNLTFLALQSFELLQSILSLVIWFLISRLLTNVRYSCLLYSSFPLHMFTISVCPSAIFFCVYVFCFWMYMSFILLATAPLPPLALTSFLCSHRFPRPNLYRRYFMFWIHSWLLLFISLNAAFSSGLLEQFSILFQYAMHCAAILFINGKLPSSPRVSARNKFMGGGDN